MSGTSGQLQSWDASRLGEMLPTTRSALESFAQRRSRLQWVRGTAIGLACLVVGMLVVAAVDHFFRPSAVPRAMLSVGGYAVAILAAWRFGWSSARRYDLRDAAAGLESTSPEVRQQLVAAVELDDIDLANGSAAFRQRLQSQVAYQLKSLDVAGVLPVRLIGDSLIIAAALVAAVALLALVPSLQMPRRLARAFLPMLPIERASITTIHWRHPDPATKMVAEGDLVAVVVAVEKLGGGEVTLQWRSDDGSAGEQRMSPRSAGSTVETIATRFLPTFASNLPVNASPVHYRVLAGDAETWWHTLTPRSRPRVVEFVKRIVPPGYAKLPEAVETDPFGDLRALVGSTASVSVRFDQPVRDAMIRFVGGESEIAMQADADDVAVWRFSLPIKTPSTYRIDATSVESGLNNPFMPSYPIDPLVDRPPLATWSDTLAARQLASPVAQLTMAGRAEDDLPIDFVIHQVVLDDGGAKERRIDLDPVSREPEIRFVWDLMAWDSPDPLDSPKGSLLRQLPSGSSLKTRLIAVDRAGHRGESAWIEVLIAGEEFQADRHDALMRLKTLTGKLNRWWASFREMSETIESLVKATREAEKERGEAPNPVAFDVQSDQLDLLRSGWTDLSGITPETTSAPEPDDEAVMPTIAGQLRLRDDPVALDQWSDIDRIASHLMAETDRTLRHVAARAKLASEPGGDERRTPIRLVGGDADETSRLAERVSETVQAMLAVELAAGLRRDLTAAATTAARLGDASSNIPITRLPGQAGLLAEQMRQISQLVTEFAGEIPESTARHHQQLHRFVNDVNVRIDEEIKRLEQSQSPGAERPFRQAMSQIASQIHSQRTYAPLDVQTFNTLATAAGEFSDVGTGFVGDVNFLVAAAEDWNAAEVELQRRRDAGDSASIAPSRLMSELMLERFGAERDLAIRSLGREEARERLRRDVDVRTAADVDLVRRAVEHVATDPPVIAPELVTTVDKIAAAGQTLLAGAVSRRLASQLQHVAEVERYGDDEADRVVRQGMRLGHFHVVSERPLTDLRRGGVEPAVIDRLMGTRTNDDFARARELIVSRRWDARPIVSAAREVERLMQTHRDAAPTIEPVLREAREYLQSLLPGLPEVAREAAKTSEATREKLADEEAPKWEQQDAMKELRAKVDEVAEQLVDRSNNADYSDADERQMARDADQALAAITRQTRAGEENLKALEETLRATADHFEKLDSGQDAAQTRAALEAAAAESVARDPAEMTDSRAAESNASAAQATPEELLQRLEQELDRDPAMQNQLSGISQRIVADAEQTVARAAEQEESLRQSLERADESFAEEKTMLRDQLNSLSSLTAAVEREWLALAESAASRAAEPKLKEQIAATRERLRQAVATVPAAATDQALMEDLKSAGDQLRQAIEQASRDASEMASQMDTDADQPKLADNAKRSRDQTARQLESEAKRAQNDWLNALKQDAQTWQQKTDQAGQRIRQAQNDQRAAEAQLRQAQSEAARDPASDRAAQQLAAARQNAADAERAIEAKQRSRALAEEQEKLADSQFQRAKSEKVESLDSPSPAEEAVEQAAERAGEQLKEIAGRLQEAQARASQPASLQPQSPSGTPLVASQQQTRRAVEEAAEDLQRAARHEQRMRNESAAERLQQAAEALARTAGDPMKTAEDQLAAQPGRNQAGEAERPSSAAQASHQLGQAAEQLRGHAAGLAELAGQSPSPTAPGESSGESNAETPSDGETSDGEPSRSEKLARTLDELDRAIHQTTPSTDANGSPPGPPPAGQPPAGSPPPGGAPAKSDAATPGQPAAPGEPAGQPQPSGTKTAGEASPTLAAAAEQAIRELAQQRQQQLDQLTEGSQPSPGDQDSGDASGEPSPGTAAKPGTQSGDSDEMPGGGLLDAVGESRRGGAWGELRDQTSEEVTQDRRTPIPAAYRRAVEAYFEAIATEAGRLSGD